MKAHMNRHTNEAIKFGPGFEHYFRLYYNEGNGKFLLPEDRTDVIEHENSLSGYFCIITSENMTAKEALLLYKNRDASEKLFRGDKSYLGDKALRVYGDSAAESKIFIEFLALVIRNRIYNCLKDEWIKLEKRPNYMTVPAALKELEKIEMVRLTDNKYRMDHAVTATQKVILKAFGMDANLIKHYAVEIGEILKEANNMARGRKAVADTLGEQIEKAQEKVIKTKAAYDHAVDALQKLLDKRDSQRKDELWNAVIHSSKSYDEILQMIADLSTEEK